MCLTKEDKEEKMKVLGWIFTVLLIAGVGYMACYFGWVEQLFALLKNAKVGG